MPCDPSTTNVIFLSGVVFGCALSLYKRRRATLSDSTSKVTYDLGAGNLDIIRLVHFSGSLNVTLNVTVYKHGGNAARPWNIDAIEVDEVSIVMNENTVVSLEYPDIRIWNLSTCTSRGLSDGVAQGGGDEYDVFRRHWYCCEASDVRGIRGICIEWSVKHVLARSGFF